MLRISFACCFVLLLSLASRGDANAAGTRQEDVCFKPQTFNQTLDLDRVSCCCRHCFFVVHDSLLLLLLLLMVLYAILLLLSSMLEMLLLCVLLLHEDNFLSFPPFPVVKSSSELFLPAAKPTGHRTVRVVVVVVGGGLL